MQAPEFQELLTKWLQTAKLENPKQFIIFESLFDDATQSTVAKFGLFYSRLFKSVYFINNNKHAAVDSQLKAAVQTLLTSHNGTTGRITDLLYFHSRFTSNKSTTALLFDSIFAQPKSSRSDRATPDYFGLVDRFCLDSIALRSNYRPTEVFEWVTNPFYLRNTNLNSFSAILSNFELNTKQLFDVAEQDISAKR